MKYGFGVDIGGTTVKLAYFDREGTMLDTWEIPTDRRDKGAHVMADIAQALLTYLQVHQVDKADIIGVGVGVPGPVNHKGVVNKCANLGWEYRDIPQELGALTGLKVKAGNDANVAALGEYWKGSARAYDSMIFITLGTGVGGGIVVEGKLLHGAHGAGGEVGHMRLVRGETEPCGCGNFGCAEQYCSATGLAKLARRRLAQDCAPSSLRAVENPVAKDVFDAARQGDALASAVLEQYFDLMGDFLSCLCAIVDPEVVVLGGGVSKAGDMLLDGVRRSYARACFNGTAEVGFALAELGNAAGSYGAFKLALDAFG